MGMSHAFYVYTSWGIGAVTLLAVVAHTWLDGVRLRRELSRLEAQGIRRRSAKSSGETA